MAKRICKDRVFLGDTDISGIVTNATVVTGVDTPRMCTITVYAEHVSTDDDGNMTIRLQAPEPVYTSPCGCIWESKNALDEGRYDKKIRACGDMRGSRG